MDRDEKGYITLLLLVLIAFGFLLSGGLMALLDQAPASTSRYVLVDTTPYPIHKTLQLSTLSFTYSAPATICDPGSYTSDEPGILYAYMPSNIEHIGLGDQIKVWYTDEHALTLGSSGGDSTKPVSTQTTSKIIQKPNILFGNMSLRDGTANNFLFYPALYLTDITDNETNIDGDAQKGLNNGIPPSIVYGYWKDYAQVDPDFIGNDNNPDANGDKLGTLPIPPATPFNLIDSKYINTVTGDRGTEPHPGQDGYQAELIWNVSDLTFNGAPLQSGKQYRAQFVIHDGDMTRGADVGVGCTCLTIL
jgi:hypothetical protein